MPLYASDIYDSHTSSEIEAMAAGFVEAGFAGLKIRLGRTALRWAADRVRVARSAVGPGFPLMVDAVQGWDLDFCRRIESTLVGLDVTWLEDPFPAGDLSSYRRLAGNYGLPICTGESCRSLATLDAVIATGPEIVMLDVQHLGGIAATIQGIERAAAAGRRLTFHVFPDLGASLGAGTAVEWLEWAPLWGGHAGQPRLSNGRVSAGSEPGLGLWTSN
jgi:L-alanine-DL-glutamate epimerase-like enolase superfamily enzyme